MDALRRFYYIFGDPTPCGKVGKFGDVFEKNQKNQFFWFKSDLFDLNRLIDFLKIHHNSKIN